MSKFEVTQELIDAVQKATGHSVYGGSSIPRIVACPASVGRELQAGLQPESKYAAKGTYLHNCSEKAERSGRPRDWILNNNELDIEDTSLLLDSTDFVHEIIDLHPDGSYTVSLEEHGSLVSYGLPEVYGTADVVIKSAGRTDVIDYKYGYGVPVYAERNLQLVSYLGMAEPFVDTPDNDHELWVHICQPPKQIFSSWRLDYQMMYEMILGQITDAIAESRGPNPSYGPGESPCRFCKANMRCEERHAWLREQALMIQSMSQNVKGVTNEQWSKFLQGWSALAAAKSQVEKFAMSEIMAGNDFPNFKCVQGKANRKFKDASVGKAFIMSRLGDRAYADKERPIITLSQAEKIDKTLKKDEQWKDMIYKPDGAVKLVPADGPGTAMVFGTASIMDDMASGKV